MRLPDFILSHMESILAHWQAFAATQLPAGASMTVLELRDDAQPILEAIAKDLRTPQNRTEQAQKSMGLAVRPLGAPITAAQTHAVLRAKSGFSIRQLVAEYRALRASVLRLWMDACDPEIPHAEDITRFNEAIDQALAESVDFYTAEVDQSRKLFLATVSHDMRTPLQTIDVAARYLSALNLRKEVAESASRIRRSAGELHLLLEDLVDLNRLNLNLGIQLHRSSVVLDQLFAEQLDDLRAMYPHRLLELEVIGGTQGIWGGPRLKRLLSNLVTNAIKHGAPDSPVRVVVLAGENSDIRFEVRNEGSIPAPRLHQLFEPLKQANPLRVDGMGLGLYIARAIAKAHGGEIHARSMHQETVFSVTLPRT